MRDRDLEAIDRAIVANIRRYRVAKQLSQAKLAERLGISYQQLQKYERCVNRISASRLLHVAQVLRVPLSVFFDGQAGDVRSPQGRSSAEGLPAP